MRVLPGKFFYSRRNIFYSLHFTLVFSYTLFDGRNGSSKNIYLSTLERYNLQSIRSMMDFIKFACTTLRNEDSIEWKFSNYERNLTIYED